MPVYQRVKCDNKTAVLNAAFSFRGEGKESLEMQS
jgi:hypothetical protein